MLPDTRGVSLFSFSGKFASETRGEEVSFFVTWRSSFLREGALEVACEVALNVAISSALKKGSPAAMFICFGGWSVKEGRCSVAP